MKLSDIKANPDNPRTIKDDKFKKARQLNKRVSKNDGVEAASNKRRKHRARWKHAPEGFEGIRVQGHTRRVG